MKTACPDPAVRVARAARARLAAVALKARAAVGAVGSVASTLGAALMLLSPDASRPLSFEIFAPFSQTPILAAAVRGTAAGLEGELLRLEIGRASCGAA